MKTLIAFTTLLLLAPLASALSPINKSKLSSLAIKGYDPVSYYTDAKATKGQKAFEYEYRGAKWRFSSKQNLDQFKADPDAYAPQFGGYCAWAVSQG
ncbi:YHS domain-containing protein [Opitutales bacterium]|nr:YHS domain-containing protein [Opitutales bacterium]